MQDVGQAHREEAAERRVEQHDDARQQDAGGGSHIEARGKGLAAAHELGRDVAHHEDEDHDGEDRPEDTVLVSQSRGEKVGKRDAVVRLRETP